MCTENTRVSFLYLPTTTDLIVLYSTAGPNTVKFSSPHGTKAAAQSKSQELHLLFKDILTLSGIYRYENEEDD